MSVGTVPEDFFAAAAAARRLFPPSTGATRVRAQVGQGIVVGGAASWYPSNEWRT